LVVTDGIQSDVTGGDFTQVTSAVSRLLDLGWRFEVIGIKSDFRGEAYSEQQGHSARLGMYDSQRLGKRPFYCYVFARQSEFVSSLSRELQSTYNLAVNRVNLTPGTFTNVAASCTVPRLVATRKANRLTRWGRTRSGVSYLRWRGKSGCDIQGRADIQLAPAPGSDGLFGDFQFNPGFVEASKCLKVCAVDVRRKRVLDVTVGIAKCDTATLILADTFSGRRKKRVVRTTVPARGVVYQLLLDGTDCRGWTGYRFAVYPGDALLPPKWVDEWSSPQDDDLRYLNRTLNLRESMVTLMRKTTFANAPLGAVYVALKN
jgi:hypothetical protein